MILQGYTFKKVIPPGLGLLGTVGQMGVGKTWLGEEDDHKEAQCVHTYLLTY